MTYKNNTFKKLTFITFVIIMFVMPTLVMAFSWLNKIDRQIFAENEITISNANFTNSSNSKPGSPNSFTEQGTKGSTVSGVIDTDTTVFQENKEDNYKLNYNPSYPEVSNDKKVLMINNQNIHSSFGYASSNFTLAKNGYYVISAYVYTQYNTDASSTASIYLSNNTFDKIDDSKLENLSTKGVWKEYRFYVQTSSNDENVNLVLYIGTQDSFTSAGAVFFDNLSAKTLSESEYYNQLKTISVEHKEVTLTSKNVSVSNGISNGDFENGSDFTRVSSSTGAGTVNNIAKVVGIGDYFNNEDSLLSTDPTQANRLNNKYALLINNNTADYVAFESNNILIEQHKNYKLSIDVKTSNFTENGANIYVKQKNPFLDESYKVAESSFTAVNTSSQTNSLTNDWITYTFYIKGNVFKDSFATLTLAVGTEDKLVKGYALFDNIILEEITTTSYNNNSGTNNKTVDFSNLSESPSIKNGAFNNVEINSTDDGYPFNASDITVSNNNENNFNGIINTNKTNFDAQNYPFLNPVSVNNSNAELSNNNVFVLANKVSDYQTAKTSTFTLSSSSYYKVSIYVNSQSLINDNLSVTLSTDKETIGQVKKINTESAWKEVVFFVKTFENEKTCSLLVKFGDETVNNKGYVFLDNAKLEKIEEEDFNNATINSLSFKTDLSKVDLSLKSNNSSNYYYAPLNFTGTKNSTEGNVEAGILNVQTHPTLDVGFVHSANILTIHNITEANYSYKSNTYKLVSGNYYKITVSVKTLNASQNELNKETTEDGDVIPFGAKIEMTGLNESFSGIITGNTYETYTFYVSATSDTEVAFNLSMGYENALTKGYAFFDNLSIEKIEQADFTTANEELKDDNKTLIIGDTDVKDDDNKDDDTTAGATNFDFLVIPTLIISLALLVAIVGALIRKLNIHLPVKTAVRDYDRAKTIVKEHERRQKLIEREERLKALRQKLLEIQKELDTTKEEYRNTKTLREQLKVQNSKIEATITKKYKDVTTKPAIVEARKLKLEAKAKLKQERRDAYLARRNELINRYLEIEKEIEMILEEERLLVQEYKAYKKQLKLEKQEAKAKKKNKNKNK